jgi:hypothetical protein
MEEPKFTEMCLEHGQYRAVWEYIGEGAMGEYNRDDPQDEPFLRFTCYQRLPAFNEIGEQVGWEWEQMTDASYCTYMPVDAPPALLAKALGLVLEALHANKSYKKVLEALSHFSYDVSHDMDCLLVGTEIV